MAAFAKPKPGQQAPPPPPPPAPKPESPVKQPEVYAELVAAPPPAPKTQLPRAHRGTRGTDNPPASSSPAQRPSATAPPVTAPATPPSAPQGFVPLDMESAAQATQPAHQLPGPALPPPDRPTTGTKTIDPLMLGPQPRPKPPPATEVPVVCRLCGTRMHAPLAKIGQKIQCPDCHTINVITGPKKPPPKKPGPTLDGAPDFGLGEPVERPAYRPIVAPRGEYAELAEFDPAQRPPGWSRPEKMTSTAASATAALEDDDEEIVVSAPVERLEIKPDIKPLPPPDPQDDLYDGKYDDGLIGDWDDRKKPEAWKRAPLTVGLVSFLFYINTFLRIVLYAAGLAVVLNIIYATAQAYASDNPSAKAASIFLSIVTAVSLGFYVASLSAVLFAIVQDTANGGDDVASYPDWNVTDWIGTAVYFPAAAFVAGLPGSFFTTALLVTGLDPTYGAFAAVAPLVLSWVLLLPFVLYSMLAEGSCLSPFSVATYKSLHAASEGWVFFFVYAFLLGLVGSGALAFAMSQHVLVNVVGSLGLILVMFLYCRILGRLMWYCSEKMAKLEAQRAE